MSRSSLSLHLGVRATSATSSAIPPTWFCACQHTVITDDVVEGAKPRENIMIDLRCFAYFPGQTCSEAYNGCGGDICTNMSVHPKLTPMADVSVRAKFREFTGDHLVGTDCARRIHRTRVAEAASFR